MTKITLPFDSVTPSTSDNEYVIKHLQTQHNHRTAHRKVPQAPTYNSWIAMKQRCYYSKSRYYLWYGARGIKVCDRWLGEFGFANFLKDMGVRPEGKTLDRINSNGNYEPSNCRWATRKEQANNRAPRGSRRVLTLNLGNSVEMGAHLG